MLEYVKFYREGGKHNYIRYLGARHPRIAEIGMQKIIYNILLRIAKEYYMHDFGDRAKIQQCK